MQLTIDEQPTFKPRNAFVAFSLSLILPGLGQMYNGQQKKAILFFVSLRLVPFLFGITRGATIFWGLFALLVIEVGLRIYFLIDAVQNARRQKNYVLKSYNTWYHYMIIGIAMSSVLWLYKVSDALGLETFKIPTTSNNPTLHVGDWLVADKQAYRNHEPDYGDIVVFKGTDEQMYTFRVVGRPNDSLELNDNIVTINGKSAKATFIKETTDGQFPVREFEEVLPNGHKHQMYKFKTSFDTTKATIKNIVVPAGSYYLLGDNRDNALDSRYTGFVNIEKITGQIIYSYWGKTADRININFKDR